MPRFTYSMRWIPPVGLCGERRLPDYPLISLRKDTTFFLLRKHFRDFFTDLDTLSLVTICKDNA